MIDTASDLGPQRAALAIRRLTIDRMPGIDRSFTIDHLSPGINLVHGPNASGKTRTSLALRELVWPGIGAFPSRLDGTFVLGDDEWQASLDGDFTAWRFNGEGSARPDLSAVPPSEADRYILTLHDLLDATRQNQDLAAVIQRQSAGGYDLPKARRTAGLPVTEPKIRRGNAQRMFNEARAALRSLQTEEETLRADHVRLDDIARDITATEHARTLLAEIEHALVAAANRASIVRLDEEIATLPPTLAALTGTEPDDLDTIAAERTELDRQRESRDRVIADANAALDITGFAETMPPDTLVPDLRERVRDLATRADAITTTERDRANRQAAIARLRTAIGRTITAEQIAALDTDGMRTLADHLRRAMEHRATLASAEEVTAWFGDLTHPTYLDPLRNTVSALYDRLHAVALDTTTTATTRARSALFAAAIVIVVLAILLAVVGEIASIALAILALPFVWAALQLPKPAPATTGTDLNALVARIGEKPPAAWTQGSIEALLPELRTKLAEAERQDAKVARWGDLQPQLEKRRAEQATIDAAAADVAASLGLDTAPAAWDDLRILAGRLDELRTAEDAIATLESDIFQRRTAWDGDFAAVNATLVEHGESASSDHTAAEIALEHLFERIATARDHRRVIADTESDIRDRIEPALVSLQTRQQAIYDRAGIPVGDRDALRDCLSHRARFVDLQERRRVAAARLDEARLAIVEHLDLLDFDADALRERQTAESAIAERRDFLIGEQRSINERIAAAERSTRTVDATLDLENAARDLERERDDAVAAAAGWELAEFVSRRSREANRPQVYREASATFSAFTNGNYTLEFADAGDAPVFQARNTATNVVLPLDQLSSGTRVQLLMAVRIAFIEVSETTWRLPLILDETLANSDDIRVDEIMTATIEIARRGRQIFYFTAQQDEVAKWSERMAAVDDVPFHRVDLRDVRQLAGAAEEHVPAVPVRVTIEPMPEGLDHAGAHEVLRVAAIDPWAQTLGGASLWYFITEPSVLWRAAREYNLLTWGQYTAHGRATLMRLIPEMEEIDRLAQLRHRAIEAAIRYWRRGRARPLLAEELASFTQMTSNQRQHLLERFEDVEGAAQALLDSIEARGIPYFGNRHEDLRVWLTEHELLPVGVRLDTDELRLHLHADLVDHMSPHEIDAILHTLALRS